MWGSYPFSLETASYSERDVLKQIRKQWLKVERELKLKRYSTFSVYGVGVICLVHFRWEVQG